MPTWALVLLATLGWCVLALLLGLGIGAVIRRRDQQVQPLVDPEPDTEPGEQPGRPG